MTERPAGSAVIGKLRDCCDRMFAGARRGQPAAEPDSQQQEQSAEATDPPMLEAERRSGRDRRETPTPALGAYWLRGSRRFVRREAEVGAGYYVDRPGRTAVSAFGLLAVLVGLDGMLTLYLIERGAFEANPVMAFFLSLGVPVFLGVKYGATAVALGVLLIHKNFQVVHPRLRVKWIIVGLIGIYGLLVAYELVAVIAAAAWSL